MTDEIDAWKRAGEAGDVRWALSAMSDDAELVSPLTDMFTFQGRTEIGRLLECVFSIVSDYRYHDDVRQGRTAFLSASMTVRGTQVEEFQRLRLDADGAIHEVVLTMRPLPALTVFTRAMGPALARAQGNPNRARALAAAGAFLDAVAVAGDRRFTPLAAPGSGPSTATADVPGPHHT